MIDRFKDGDISNTRKVPNDTILPIANYFGGDLRGVIDKIEDQYFEKSGN
jgi:cyclomaltodextrinase